MAKSSEKPMKSEEAALQANVEALVASNGETMKAVMKANESMFGSMAAINREIFDFGSTRLRHDIETSRSLMGCKDAEEAFRLQCDFTRAAAQQYFEEAGKLMNLTAEFTRDYWAPIEDRTKEALHDLNGD
jgi:hypothetical protein